jgi:hypothetical protein
MGAGLHDTQSAQAAPGLLYVVEYLKRMNRAQVIEDLGQEDSKAVPSIKIVTTDVQQHRFSCS